MVPAALLLLLLLVGVVACAVPDTGAQPTLHVQTMSARETVPPGDNKRRPQNRKPGSERQKESFTSKIIPIHILKPFRFCTHSEFQLRPVLRVASYFYLSYRYYRYAYLHVYLHVYSYPRHTLTLINVLVS